MGGTFKAEGTGKCGGQEQGHSKAGVVFLSLGPTLQEQWEGPSEGAWKPKDSAHPGGRASPALASR